MRFCGRLIAVVLFSQSNAFAWNPRFETVRWLPLHLSRRLEPPFMRALMSKRVRHEFPRVRQAHAAGFVGLHQYGRRTSVLRSIDESRSTRQMGKDSIGSCCDFQRIVLKRRNVEFLQYTMGERKERPREHYVIVACLAFGHYRNAIPHLSGIIFGPLIFEFCPHNNIVAVLFSIPRTPHYFRTGLLYHRL